MAALPFVDTHVHFWDHSLPDVSWDWLVPGAGVMHPVFGAVEPITAPRYTGEEFGAEVAGANVRAAVHVQAAVGTPDPVAETRWLEQVAERTGWPHALVAHAELADPALERTLERHREAATRLCGIRDLSARERFADPALGRGAAALARHDLLLELDCGWEQMKQARALAARHPELIVVLDHAGFPTERTPEYAAAWRRGIATLAEAGNVRCKISGLGMGDPQWTVASIEPYVMHCIESFGVERCVFGTNWPIDRLFSSYDAVVDAYAEIVAPLGRADQAALFHGNAEQLFQIPPPTRRTQ